MSSIETVNTRALWRRRMDEDAYDPDRDGRPRDWWGIGVLWRSGCLTRRQWDAARRLERLLERGLCGGRTEGTPKVDAGPSDPHARLWDQAKCGDAAAEAIYVVMQTLTTKSARLLFFRAFEYPHRSVREIAEGDKEAVGRRLGVGLESLADHFDSEDERRVRLGLDRPHKIIDRVG